MQASVTIKVPPQTKPADIQVTFKQNTLHVAVKDRTASSHAKNPLDSLRGSSVKIGTLQRR